MAYEVRRRAMTGAAAEARSGVWGRSDVVSASNAVKRKKRKAAAHDKCTYPVGLAWLSFLVTTACRTAR
eukprot:3662804-Rhodomonas_salina.1